jgi:ABC-type polar amino acid transport system ATPase subunit
MTEAVRVEDLSKSFDDLEVLKDIDLAVAEHEVVCLIGASGSGKSTLLRCINLLEEIDSGGSSSAARDHRQGRQRQSDPAPEWESCFRRSTCSRT